MMAIDMTAQLAPLGWGLIILLMISAGGILTAVNRPPREYQNKRAAGGRPKHEHTDRHLAEAA